jgi:hypothetical protein
MGSTAGGTEGCGVHLSKCIPPSLAHPPLNAQPLHAPTRALLSRSSAVCLEVFGTNACCLGLAGSGAGTLQGSTAAAQHSSAAVTFTQSAASPAGSRGQPHTQNTTLPAEEAASGRNQACPKHRGQPSAGGPAEALHQNNSFPRLLCVCVCVCAHTPGQAPTAVPPHRRLSR